MLIQQKLFTYPCAILMTASLALSVPVHASDTSAFIGGMVTSKVLNNMSRRTAAEEQQARNSAAPQPVQQATSAPAALTPQQKIDQLDKLAAGGYITPAEYKAKKQAIMNGM